MRLESLYINIGFLKGRSGRKLLSYALLGVLRDLTLVPTKSSDNMAQDIAILVLGLTKAGKTTFVNYVMNRTSVHRSETSEGLTLCTKEISEERIPNPNGSQFPGFSEVFIVDTPGFDDKSVMNTIVWQKIISWLEQSRGENPNRHIGVIYLTSITECRIIEAETQCLRYCRLLFGSNGCKKVVFASTKWDRVLLKEATTRHAELRNLLWNTMIDNGSQAVVFKRGHAGALKIVHTVIKSIEEKNEGISVGGESLKRIKETISQEERIREPSNILAKISSYFRRTFAAIFSVGS